MQFAPSLIIARILNYVSRSQVTPAVSLTILFPALTDHMSPPVMAVVEQIYQLLHNEGVLLSVLLFTILCAKTAIENQYFDAISRMSAEIRGTLSTAVYRKALKLSAASRQNNTVRCCSLSIWSEQSYFNQRLICCVSPSLRLLINNVLASFHLPCIRWGR